MTDTGKCGMWEAGCYQVVMRADGSQVNTSAANSGLRRCCDTVDVGGTREVTSGAAAQPALRGGSCARRGAGLCGRGRDAATASGWLWFPAQGGAHLFPESPRQDTIDGSHFA